MAIARDDVVDKAFLSFAASLTAQTPRHDLDAPVRPGSSLSARRALRIFESQVASRHCDLLARDLKRDGHAFYTIGSSGHEGNAAVADALRPEDPAFLHYRSGGFFLARARQVAGPAGAFDVALGLVASADEPIAGGRHKVFGSVPLQIPPQTSTIASQLPKAVGCALALDRRARREGRREERIAVCTFGDASANHSTATGAVNAAAWSAYQNVPVPLLFVCEDNGIGISVRTPTDWIRAAYGQRPGLAYFEADGIDLVEAFEVAEQAATWVRTHRKPAFLRLRTVRLLGHAGSDVELLYRSAGEIAADEARDPLLRSAALLVEGGWMSPEQVVALYEQTRATLAAMGREVIRRPKLQTAAEVMQPLFFHDEEAIARALPRVDDAVRTEVLGSLPEQDERPRHLAVQLNRALADVLLSDERAILFGEDVARKGGVYHVTAELSKRFGVGRVFNTLLDEQTILGIALGAAHAGMLPIPEIQYLAYLMNAIDQLRGEAGSLQFFSNGQYANGMVVRIAGLAYQKGFGGHFHNDNGIGPLLEIPGLLVGCPARGDDAVRMLRTMAGAARACGRVSVLLEPIALYMTKDLHTDGDGAWLSSYPAPGDLMPVGEVGVYGDGTDVCVITYANGLWMSLRVVERLAAEGIRARVIDLRWLSPLPHDALEPHARAAGRVLIVDEARAHSGVADHLAAELHERIPGLRLRRVTGMDTYIPLGAAANLVLVQEADIEAGLRAVLETP